MQYSDIEKIKREYMKTIQTFEKMLNIYSTENIEKKIKGDNLLLELKKSIQIHESDFEQGNISIEELYDNIKSVNDLLLLVMKKDSKRPNTNYKNLNE